MSVFLGAGFCTPIAPDMLIALFVQSIVAKIQVRGDILGKMVRWRYFSQLETKIWTTFCSLCPQRTWIASSSGLQVYLDRRLQKPMEVHFCDLVMSTVFTWSFLGDWPWFVACVNFCGIWSRCNCWFRYHGMVYFSPETRTQRDLRKACSEALQDGTISACARTIVVAWS